MHKEILFMAGQLGLDPPTMLLCSGGAIAELDQALKNCEAVAESFDCSIASSAISLLIYCSTSLTVAERIEVEHRQKSFLHKKISETQSTIFLYVLAPNLPKRYSFYLSLGICQVANISTCLGNCKMNNNYI